MRETLNIDYKWLVVGVVVGYFVVPRIHAAVASRTSVKAT